MAKYELIKKTENNGDVWYYIRKDDFLSVENSWTRKLEDAERLFNEFVNGKPSEPIIETIKEIEVNEN